MLIVIVIMNRNNKTVNGVILGGIEIGLLFMISTLFRFVYNLNDIPIITFYWLSITILTGVWECSYIYNYDKIISLANRYIEDKKHVWTTHYNLRYLRPDRFAQIFYAEYAAYADHEYKMNNYDIWSRIVESTHAIFCSVFVLLSFLIHSKYSTLLAVAMGGQLMNSILYISRYSIDLSDEDNVNYITDDFPAGKYLSKRPFMYVNLIWLLMPSYIIIQQLLT